MEIIWIPRTDRRSIRTFSMYEEGILDAFKASLVYGLLIPDFKRGIIYVLKVSLVYGLQIPESKGGNTRSFKGFLKLKCP